MAKPIVTIGFCVRDCEDFIEEAIDSVKEQDFSHECMEAIFVDDGSTDKTLSIIQRHSLEMDMHVTVFHQDWKGIGSGRNLVINNAQGEYIIWVDGDMVLSSDYVRKQVDFMEQNPRIGIAKGQYGLTPGANLLATLEIYSRAASKMVNFNYNARQHAKSLGAGGCIYRVKAIKDVGCFDEKMISYNEDFDAEYRVKKAGWLLCIIPVRFRDYERRGIKWRQLWLKYFQRGYYSYFFLRKNERTINVHNMLPPVTALAGLLDSFKIYRLTCDTSCFLLPFQYAVKSTAWFLGFINGSSARGSMFIYVGIQAGSLITISS